MSINVLKEFLIHFHTFRNIDLINQGLYQIRAKIYYTENSLRNLRHSALPYFFIESKEGESNSLTDEHNIKPHSIISNHIGENNSEYVTKTFLVRYSDEEVEIDEFCYFRIEVESKKLMKSLMYHIEFELFFSDTFTSVNKEKRGAENVLSNVEFRSVATQTLIINVANDQFLEQYAPIVYNDSYSSILNVSIHTVLLDYKLRINDLKPFSIEVEVNKTNTQTGTTNTANNGVNNQNNTNGGVNSNNKTNKTLLKSASFERGPVINSLIQFFLNDYNSPYNLEPEIIDKLYSQYVISLINQFSSLKGRYSRLLGKLLDERMKSEFPFFVIIQPLSLYYEDKDKTVVNLEELNTNSEAVLKLSSRISDYKSEYIAQRLLLEINFVGGQIYQLWHKYIELMRFFPTQTNYILQTDYSSKYKEDLGKFMKRSIISVSDISNVLFPVETNLGEINKKLADEMRVILAETLIRSPISDRNNQQSYQPFTFPILFEELYIKQMALSSENRNIFGENFNIDKHNFDSNEVTIDTSIGLHLIVLVHGYQANSYDMRVIKNTIALINPSCVFLPSCANQDDTECGIEEMGLRLSNEVKAYIKEWSNGSIFKNFIGHSMGGMIIRAALPHLKEFSQKMWMYLSLSTPHLGCLYSSSRIVEAGMWVLKKWKKTKSIEELCLTDSSDLKDTAFYKLSEIEGLDWFNYIYFLSSHQDHYTPYESTRIQLAGKSLNDNHKANMYRNMAYNILSKITKDSVRRVDINFVIAEKNIDSFIGRTAHIQFLENVQFMKTFFYSIEDILK